MPAHILIIEDNPENLDLMRYLLESFRYAVVSASDGDQGLARAVWAQARSHLCDLQMPKLKDLEVIRPIRDNTQLRDKPVIAVTAYAMRDDREKVLAAGFDGYVDKPIVPEDFVSRVEHFLSSGLRSGERTPARIAHYTVDVDPRASGSRRTILAVDDRQVNLTLVRSILEPFGYRVIAVDSVKKGWKSPARTLLISSSQTFTFPNRTAINFSKRYATIRHSGAYHSCSLHRVFRIAGTWAKD
jgi:CheY-like chemotaxis protein